MEQLKFSYIVGRTVHWYNHCGKFAASTKKQHPFHTLKPSNSMSKYSPNNAFAHENMYKNKLSIFYMFINIIYIFINMYHYSLQHQPGNDPNCSLLIQGNITQQRKRTNYWWCTKQMNLTGIMKNKRSQTRKEYSLHDSICVKDKHRQNKSMAMEVRIEFTFAGEY